MARARITLLRGEPLDNRRGARSFFEKNFVAEVDTN